MCAMGRVTFLIVSGPCFTPGGINAVKLSLIICVSPSIVNSISAPRSMIFFVVKAIKATSVHQNRVYALFKIGILTL